jgi:hypothetical protein
LFELQQDLNIKATTMDEVSKVMAARAGIGGGFIHTSEFVSI